MAWLTERARRSSTALVPVIGPRTTSQLDDYLAALDLPLSPAQYTRLAEVSARAGAPGYKIAPATRSPRLRDRPGGESGRFRRPQIPVS